MSPNKIQKTKQDWKNDIVELLDNFSTHYTDGNGEALKELMTEDIHRMVPGRPTMIGREDLIIKPDFKLKMKLEDLRYFYGNGAVFEFSAHKPHRHSHEHSDTAHKKGMALVVDTDGQVLLKSIIWNA